MLPRLIAVLRICIGVVFLFLGVSALLDEQFLYGGLLLDLQAKGSAYNFYQRNVIDRYVLLHQTLFAYVVAIGEVLIGFSLLTGALVSWGALGGAFLMLNLGLAISDGNPLQMVLHGFYALVFLALARAAAGLKWGVDGWLAERIDERFLLFPFRLTVPSYMQDTQRTRGS